jgi:predicted small secreted protein
MRPRTSNKNYKNKRMDMKKLLFIGVVVVSMVLAACQVNNVRDTGGGAVSPSSTVTLDSAMNGNP